MGVKQVNFTRYECDVCGHQTENPLDRDHHAEVTMTRTIQAYNGDVGGATSKEWWCGACVASFIEWKTLRRKESEDGRVRSG